MTQSTGLDAVKGSGMAVTEGVSGYNHYHLSDPSDPEQIGLSLCGRPVMKSGIALADWKKPFGEHFPKKPTWCEACETAARERSQATAQK